MGLATKKFSPRTSLATLFVACQLLDLIWPIAMLIGLESSTHDHSIPTFNNLNLSNIPYSHSLGMAIIWFLLFGIFIKLKGRSTRAGIVVAFLVFSHWILDYITHIPDLPLWFGSAKVGLGLWKSTWATYIVEMSLFSWGVWLYCRTTRPFSKKRKLKFSSLAAFLVTVYWIHVFGPRPPETDSALHVAGPASALWVVVLWAYFADKNSITRPAI